MSDLAIRVEDISKRYRIGKKRAAGTFREFFTQNLKSRLRCPIEHPTGEFWALQDISFDVKRGQVVGIIGRNGAGKSTLLRILSRITEPTSGRAEVYGRVGSLLEVGTGFHPELTGRENVYLNGAILGMKRRDIDRQFDEIVEFAEVQRFIDTPVKHYSSGMHVRLAFAVAAHLEPEVLIIDEVLAVGDAEFQRKCLGKMETAAHDGRTVLFVSHNVNALALLCNSLVRLEKGRVAGIGNPSVEIAKYLQTDDEHNLDRLNIESSYCEGGLSLRFTVRNDSEIGASILHSADDIGFLITATCDTPIQNASLGIGIDDMLGNRIVTLHTRYQMQDQPSIDGRQSFHVTWRNNFLAPGQYRIVIAVYDKDYRIGYWDNAKIVTICPVDYFGTGQLPLEHQGKVLARATWNELDE